MNFRAWSESYVYPGPGEPDPERDFYAWTQYHKGREPDPMTDYEGWLAYQKAQTEQHPYMQKVRKMFARSAKWKHPDILYHDTDTDNWEDILQHGLDPKHSKSPESFGVRGVYLTDVPSHGSLVVNAKGLDLEVDPGGSNISRKVWGPRLPQQGEEGWWVSYKPIPPERILDIIDQDDPRWAKLF